MAIPPRKGFALDLPHPIGHMRRCKRPIRPAMILLGARRAQERWAGHIARDQRRGTRSPLNRACLEIAPGDRAWKLKTQALPFPTWRGITFS
jgi:hypothetical protein